MDYEFQLHPPPTLLADSAPWYDAALYWKVEETAFVKNPQLWGWTGATCQRCDREAGVYTTEGGYRCWAHAD